jgi:hypothetical protein
MFRGLVYGSYADRHQKNKARPGRRTARLRAAASAGLEALECRLCLSTARLAVVSDYGTDTQPEADVANLVKSWDTVANPLSAILTAGDNDQFVGDSYDRYVGKYYHEYIYGYSGAYGTGSATQRFLPAPGNHDWGSGSLTNYTNFFGIPTSSSGNERYYNYTIGPVEVFMLDSDLNEPDGNISGSKQAQWLQTAMQASAASWQLVFFHHTAYSSAESHGGSDWMRWPLQQWGADAVFSGHNHVYERVNVGGLRYFTVGLGGNTLGSFTTPVAGSEVRYRDNYGAMLMDATDTQLSMQFVNRLGAVIDTFAMTNVTMPMVSIAATDNSANEGTQDAATFTISRTTVLSGDLTVNYNIGGTAANGGDYQSISGSVVIPDGQASATVTITPINDALAEGDETVLLTLNNDPAYLLGTSSATATLADDDVQTTTFLQGIDTYINSAAPSASYAGDAALNVDTDDAGGYQQSLIRFTNLIGSNPGQIPAGSAVLSAQLELKVTNIGHTVNLHRMLRTWTDADTWNSLGSGVQLNNSEALASLDVAFTPSVVQVYSLNVTNSLQAWLADPSRNFGWVLSPTGTDGVDIDSFENSLEGAVKPRLVVTYAPGDPPTAGDDTYSTTEDGPLNVPAASGVLVNDTDSGGDPLSAVLVAGSASGAVVLNSDGSFTYTPNLNFHGTDSFTYKAFDGAAYSNVASVVISVASVNDVPVAAGDSYSMTEGTTLSVAVPGVLANDTDADGDARTARLIAGPANGVLALNADGSFTYTPGAGFEGNDSFTYVANDATADSSEATVAIAVNHLNVAPSASDDGFTVAEDGVLNVALPGVLANDTDPDGDPLSSLLISGPSGGGITLNADGSFTYTPNANFHGADGFTYQISDGHGGTAVASVAITVTSVNDAPVAVGDTASVNENGTLNGASVLGNDSDGDGDPLSAVWASGPANGLLTLNANGTYTYTPDVGFSGTDSFTYVANDGTANSDMATVAITVAPATRFDYAVGESPVYGTVLAGNYTQTQAGDDTYEAIREVLWNSSRRTRLEHRWQFNVAGGDAVTFYVEAYRSSGVDSFAFQYSTDGATWLPMLTVSKTVDDDQYQSFELPASTSGAIQVRAIDTDSTNMEKGQETLYVDQLFFQSVTGGTPLPTVTITASDSAASETGDPGQCTITRTGDTAAPLTVVINIAGTATNGSDYVTIPTAVTIPAGESSAVFSILPIQDMIAEGDETIVVSFAADPAYKVGAASSGTVTIADDEPIVTTPAAPSNLAGAALSTTQIQLTWTDNANNEDGFYIEYATNANFTNAVSLSVGGNTTSHAVGGLAANTLYYFRVRAYNAGGESAWSNVIQVRTKRK